MPTLTAPKYKTLKKITNTREQLTANHEYFKENELKNKLYKQLKELADEMVNTVQYVINHRGAYENAGQDEIRTFEDIVRDCEFHYQQQCNLIEYINRKVDNLKY